MNFAPLSPLGIASRSAFRAEAGAAMEGDVPKLCFLVAATVLITAFVVLVNEGAKEWMRQAVRGDEEGLGR